MDSVIAAVCHNEASLSFCIGLKSTLMDLKDNIFLNWVQLSPFTIEIIHKFGEQQKVLQSNYDLQSAIVFSLFNKLPTLDLYVYHRGESSSSVCHIGAISSSSSHGSEVVPVNQPLVTTVTDYDDPKVVKEPLKSARWLGFFHSVEQVFPGGVDQVRHDLMKYHAANGYAYKVTRNEKLRIASCCANKKKDKCNWHMYAISCDGVEGSPFIIKELNNQHTCDGGFINVPNVSKNLISSLIKDEIKQNPKKKTKDIMEQIRREYGFDISRYYAYEGKRHALNMAWGEDEKSFAYLHWYTKQLSETNPGSRVVLETDASQKFVILFIAFGACIRGFNYCRPLLFMDAAHLKSKYLGHMMAATRLNGDNGIYPLAYGVVSSETDAKWKWFMEQLRDVVSPQKKLTFVSDRGSGLVNQILVIFPGAYHGWCYWHMSNNVNACLPKSAKTYNNYVLKLFEKCAYANTHVEFKESWDELMLVKNRKLQEYLCRAPLDKWEEREMPIAVMVDKIRLKLMEMMCIRREECVTSFDWRGVLCPKMETELYNNKMHGRDYNVTKSSEFLYEVHASLTQRVDLKEKTCSCNHWKINGFPCADVVRCIMGNGEDPYEYVEDYFTAKFYRESYSRPIHTVPTVERPATTSPKSVVHGPKVLPQSGRPSKKKRIPNISSIPKKKMRTCGGCNELTTHNQRTCPNKQT
ncbi:uncharacterized protein LOC113291509 [Papaver somniferum]|uniref:uncharacterized protein LOC113291509 n=1 Tax=Papaver somniferum TaxID=3469 RepID=UPI000E6F7D46|nr:uncharacterized protein LOC113291509 [Papaver somniferum]